MSGHVESQTEISVRTKVYDLVFCASFLPNLLFAARRIVNLGRYVVFLDFTFQSPHSDQVRPSPTNMAAKKKKTTRANGVHPVDGKPASAHLPVQSPVNAAVSTETHTPILAKPRKKKNKFSNPQSADCDGIQPSSHGVDAVVTDKLRETTDAEHKAPFVLAEAKVPDELSRSSPTSLGTENDRHWGSHDVDRDETRVSQPGATGADVDLSFLDRVGNTSALKGGRGQPHARINPARQEALEAVSDFKSRVLQRAAKKALNDTPFTRSLYPNDLYLYNKPGNTPEDAAMLNLKRRFDAAIIELDPGLAPATAEIPLPIAKRTAMYICGLLQSHDCQFRCTMDGLRAPIAAGKQSLAPWVADTWEERLADSDRDWLVSKKIEDMDNDKARKHVGDCMDFIMKYKLWGRMVEAECAELGIQLFPRLN